MVLTWRVDTVNVLINARKLVVIIPTVFGYLHYLYLKNGICFCLKTLLGWLHVRWRWYVRYFGCPWTSLWRSSEFFPNFISFFPSFLCTAIGIMCHLPLYKITTTQSQNGFFFTISLKYWWEKWGTCLRLHWKSVSEWGTEPCYHCVSVLCLVFWMAAGRQTRQS